MEINLIESEPASVVAIAGSVDALTAGEVTNYLIQQVNDGRAQIILDISGVEFMSSAGLRAILAALKQSRQQGGDLRLASARPGVEKILRMAGFTSILKTYPSVPDALSSFQG